MNPRPFVYETNARPLSYSARKDVTRTLFVDEPGRSRTRIDLFRRQALCPLSYRPGSEGDGEIRTLTLLFTRQPLCHLELRRRVKIWPGREAKPCLSLNDPRAVAVLRRTSQTPRYIHIRLLTANS